MRVTSSRPDLVGFVDSSGVGTASRIRCFGMRASWASGTMDRWWSLTVTGAMSTCG